MILVGTPHIALGNAPGSDGPRQRQPFGADDAAVFGFDDFGLAVDDETQRPPHGNHREGFERRIQCETAHRAHPVLRQTLCRFRRASSVIMVA